MSLEYFQMEAAERLERMGSGLLALEQAPSDRTLIVDLFREAHSLKGAAGVSGLTDVSEVCHKMEDLLSALRDGSREADGPIIDTLLSATDDVRRMVTALGEQETCEIDPHAVIERLSRVEGEKENQTTAAAPVPESIDADAPAETAQAPSGPQAPAAIVAAGADSAVAGGPAISKLSQSPAAPAPLPPRDDTDHSVRSDDNLVAPVEDATEASAADKRSTDAEASPLSADTVRLRIDMLESIGNLTGELMVVGDRLSQHVAALQELRALVNRQRSQHPDAHDLLNPISQGLRQLAESFGSDVATISPLISDVHEQVLDTRMLPLSVLFDSLPRFVRDSCRSAQKEATLSIDGADTRVDRQVLEQLRDPIVHLIRNAVAHGIESPDEREQLGKPRHGTIRLQSSRRGDRICITCEDDGGGIDRQRVLKKAIAAGLIGSDDAADLSDQQVYRLILEPGLSTAEMITDVCGRGVGMDVVDSRLKAMRGTLSVESRPGRFTRFTLEFPASMATVDGLLVESGGHNYILPTASVERTERIRCSELQVCAGGELMVALNGQGVPVTMLSGLLGRSASGSRLSPSAVLPAVLLRRENRLIAVGVDRLIGTQTVVARPLSECLGEVHGVAGATILGDGRPALILDPTQLIRHGSRLSRLNVPDLKPAPRTQELPVLVVDDSLTTRMMEKSILESAGYTVHLAVSPADALAKIEDQDYRLIVSDVEMPGMNGFQLTRELRKIDRFSETPIIIVTSLATDEHRREGLESGANAYIVKSEFDQNNLLETVERLVGT